MPRVENTDLSQQIAALPEELVAALAQLTAAAQTKDCQIYLVGGAPRDLLLGHSVHDADIVVLGDVATLAKAFVTSPHKITLHSTFGAATVILDNIRLDLSSARSESYAYSGALPTIHPGTLKDDLRRRDFTINTMAVSLNTGDYGRLIDYCGGQADLEARLIRTLHPLSFADDPTRIWRAVRYEQRLGFNIEPNTLKWLTQNLARLKNLTGDRIWYELECSFQENNPELVLTRLGELGALRLLFPGIQADDWLAQKYQEVRALGSSSLSVYLALLTYRLRSNATKALADYLHLDNSLRRILRDTQDIKAKLQVLSRPNLKPSTIYNQLHGYVPEALETARIASTSPAAKRHIALYQNKLRMERPSLTGDDLLALGIPKGPIVGELLQKLLKARLDEGVKNRNDEISLVKTFITRRSPPGHPA